MLISKSKISDGDIGSFKLNNGDELVAKVVSQTDTMYTISKPCMVVPGQKGIGLMQAMFTVDQEVNVELSKQHVMMSAPTIKGMQDHYIQITTGIQTVAGGIIT
jgi:hypothetical protein